MADGNLPKSGGLPSGDFLDYEEYLMFDEYEKMEKAISLISQLRAIFGQIREIKEEFDNQLTEKAKKNALSLYENGLKIFAELVKLEIGKVGKEIETSQKLFLKDIESLKKTGKIPAPKL